MTLGGIVVTLCGSAKHKKRFDEIERYLTLNGAVVLSLAKLPKGFDVECRRSELFGLHQSKIRVSDAVVVTKFDHIGKDTTDELEFAHSLKKPVIVAMPIFVPQIANDLFPIYIQKLEKRNLKKEFEEKYNEPIKAIPYRQFMDKQL